MDQHTAFLTTALALQSNGTAQLLPAGEFKARDGRPGKNLSWKVNDARGAALAAQINDVASRTPMVIDYEHQTMLSAENGQKAPAAGWVTHVDWQNGRGLFAPVDWTKAARQHIEAGEYKFISPVIDYDKRTGEITGVHNAALTNFPALTGMDAVTAQLRTRLDSARVPAMLSAKGLRHMEAAALVDQAIVAGQLQPPLCEWAMNLAEVDLESLRAFLAATAPGSGRAALSADAENVLRMSGVTREQFERAGAGRKGSA